MSDNEREQHEYHMAKHSLKISKYQMTDDIDKRCNVCDSGRIVLFDGCRLCRQHETYVTCGATCDLHKTKVKEQ